MMGEGNGCRLGRKWGGQPFTAGWSGGGKVAVKGGGKNANIQEGEKGWCPILLFDGRKLSIRGGGTAKIEFANHRH